MIRYEWIDRDLIAVFLDNKRVGKIQVAGEGWFYTPKGGRPGDKYLTLAQCKRSLEEE